jgi:hypothetical protein
MTRYTNPFDQARAYTRQEHAGCAGPEHGPRYLTPEQQQAHAEASTLVGCTVQHTPAHYPGHTFTGTVAGAVISASGAPMLVIDWHRLEKADGTVQTGRTWAWAGRSHPVGALQVLP